MCERYSQAQGLAALEERFKVKQQRPGAASSYNIAKGQPAPIIVSGIMKTAKWGFVPGWSGDTVTDGFINARAEGLASRPTFKTAFYKSRCLVPADGFYAWGHSAGEQIPYRFELRDKSPFAMAGVYDETTNSFAVITCVSGMIVRPVDRRMPVILDKPNEKLWLDMRSTNTEELLPLLRPYDSALLRGFRISSAVNSIENTNIDCSLPLEDK